MSIVKICNGSNLGNERLRDLHQYLIDPVKTDDQRLIGGHAGGRSIEAMEAVKKLYHKSKGRQFIHVVISPTVDGYIAPDQYLEAANYVAQLYPDNQSVFAVHTDSNHIHMHIVYNSVSYKTGQKFSMSKAQLNRFRTNVNSILNKFGFQPIYDSANLMLEPTPFLENTGFEHLEIDESILPPSSVRSDIDIFADRVQIDPIMNPDYPTPFSHFGQYFYSANEIQNNFRRNTQMKNEFFAPNPYIPTPQTTVSQPSVAECIGSVDTAFPMCPTLSIDVGTHLEVKTQPDTDLSGLTPLLESMYRQSESMVKTAVNAGYALSRKANAQDLPLNIHVDASPHLHITVEDTQHTSSPYTVDTTLEDSDD